MIFKSDKTELKTCLCEIINSYDALKAEEDACVPISHIPHISQEEIGHNYNRIKEEPPTIIEAETERIDDTPGPVHLPVVREE